MYACRTAGRVKRSGGGFALEHDPVSMPVLQRIIRDFLNGTPVSVIAKQLTEEGVASPHAYEKGEQGGRWNHNGIRNMLRSKTLLGWTTHRGETLLDETGKPIIKAPPAIDPETYQRIQDRLSATANVKTVPDRTSPLLGVLVCWDCGKNMYYQRNKTHVNNYHCPRCGGQYLNGDQVTDLVYSGFLGELGRYPVTEKKITKANNLSGEISEAKQSLNSLIAYIPNARTDEARAKLYEQLAMIEPRIETLESENTETDRVEWVESGQTYAELWETLDEQQRRLLMVESGFTVRARALTKGSRFGWGTMESEMFVPEDLKQRLGITEDVPPEPLEGYSSDG